MVEPVMIGMDTNVLLRVMLADEARQLDAVRRFLRTRSSTAPAFISLLVVAETSWVLKRTYGTPNPVIASAFLQLLSSPEFMFEEESFLTSLFRTFPSGQSDISDHIVSFMSKRAGCAKTYTFDQKAARSVPGMDLLA